MDGKKLLVISDTHGSITSLTKVLEWAAGQLPPTGTICAAAFLGDGISDLNRAANSTGFYCEWKLVNGNNDYDYTMPEAGVFDFEDNRFFLCHGHRHNLYGGYHSLITAARNSQANVVLFGHSHVPYQKTVEGILLVNPGSVGRPRSRIGASFAVIECKSGEQPQVEFFGIGERTGIRKLNVKS
jgi:putative phosphoesterase